MATRAPRNRTLLVTEQEAAALRKKLLSQEDLKGNADLANRIVHADLFRAIQRVPDQFADLIIIDPPYNRSKNFSGMRFSAMADSAYDEYLASWFPQVCAKLKPGGSLYICCDWQCTASVQRAVQKELFILNRITWQREKGRGAKANWKNCAEDIWFAVKNPRDYCFNADAVKLRRKVIAPYRVDGKPKDWHEQDGAKFRDTCPSNFWDDISVPFWSMPENTEHPTQKPEKLIAKLVLASSRPGQMVFDPFAGSGTTCVVAKKLGRAFCGIELSETYCLLAQKRLDLADTDTAIQGYAGGIFWERNSHPPSC